MLGGNLRCVFKSGLCNVVSFADEAARFSSGKVSKLKQTDARDKF